MANAIAKYCLRLRRITSSRSYLYNLSRLAYLGAEQLNSGGVFWGRDANFDLLAKQRGFKVRLQNDFNLQLLFSNFAHKRNNAKRQRNILETALENDIRVDKSAPWSSYSASIRTRRLEEWTKSHGQTQIWTNERTKIGIELDRQITR